LLLINCWVQICENKCIQRICLDSSKNNRNQETINDDGVTYDDDQSNNDYIALKETSVRLLVEDPYGYQRSSSNKFKNERNLQNIIGMALFIL
jgi:hypothetical protein